MHVNESCHKRECLVTHAYKWDSSDTCKLIIWHMRTSQIWTSHVSHVNDSCHTHVLFVGTVRTPHKEHCITNTNMEWLQRVGFLDCYVSFDKRVVFLKNAYSMLVCVNRPKRQHKPQYGASSSCMCRICDMLCKFVFICAHVSIMLSTCMRHVTSVSVWRYTHTS